MVGVDEYFFIGTIGVWHWGVAKTLDSEYEDSVASLIAVGAKVTRHPYVPEDIFVRGSSSGVILQLKRLDQAYNIEADGSVRTCIHPVTGERQRHRSAGIFLDCETGSRRVHRRDRFGCRINCDAQGRRAIRRCEHCIAACFRQPLTALRAGQLECNASFLRMLQGTAG